MRQADYKGNLYISRMKQARASRVPSKGVGKIAVIVNGVKPRAPSPPILVTHRRSRWAGPGSYAGMFVQRSWRQCERERRRESTAVEGPRRRNANGRDGSVLRPLKGYLAEEIAAPANQGCVFFCFLIMFRCVSFLSIAYCVEANFAGCRGRRGSGCS